MKQYDNPLAMVDVALFTIRHGRLSLLLATRKNQDEPYAGAPALPGGVIHTDKDYSSETFVFTDPKTMQWRVDERRSIVFKKVD